MTNMIDYTFITEVEAWRRLTGGWLGVCAVDSPSIIIRNTILTDPETLFCLWRHQNLHAQHIAFFFTVIIGK